MSFTFFLVQAFSEFHSMSIFPLLYTNMDNSIEMYNPWTSKQKRQNFEKFLQF